MRFLLLLCGGLSHATALVPLGCFSTTQTAGVVRLRTPESSVHLVGQVCLQTSQFIDVWVKREALSLDDSVNVSVRTRGSDCCVRVSIAEIDSGYPVGAYHPCSKGQEQVSQAIRTSSIGLLDAYFRALTSPHAQHHADHVSSDTQTYAEYRRTVRLSKLTRWQGFRIALEAQTGDPAATLQYELQIGTPLAAEPSPLPLSPSLQSLEDKSRALVRARREKQLMASITDFPDDGTLHTTDPAFLTRGVTLVIMTTLFVLVALYTKIRDLVAALTCSDKPQTSWWFNHLPEKRILVPVKIAGSVGLVVFAVYMLAELIAAVGFDASFLPAWTAALFETQLALFVGLQFLQGYVRRLVMRGRLVLGSSQDLPRSEVQHLSGPQLAAYLRFQAEVQTKPSMSRRLGGVVLAVGSSAVGATVAGALLTLDALDVALGITSLGGTLVGWVPGLGLPARAVSLAHHTVGFAQTVRAWLANWKLWKNVFFLGAPAVRDVLYSEASSRPRLGLQAGTVLRLQALVAVALWAVAHTLATWHWMPDPDFGGSVVRWVIDSLVLVAFIVTLPLWVAYGVSRVVEYPVPQENFAVESDKRVGKK